MTKPIDFSGRKFGYLTAVKDSGSDGKKRLWLLRCICGNEVVQNTTSFQRNQSCGCKRGELIAKSRRTHGMSKHPVFAVWQSMLDRCRLPTHRAWKNYGARGITVCRRWYKFENFWSDMGPTYKSGLTLERKDNNRGYTPTNCIWATYVEQARNRRNSRLLSTPWGRITVMEAAVRSGIGFSTIHWRVTRGWPHHMLFIRPDVANRVVK